MTLSDKDKIRIEKEEYRKLIAKQLREKHTQDAKSSGEQTEDIKRVAVPVKSPEKTKNKQVSNIPKAPNKKKGCLGKFIGLIVLLAIVLVFVYLRSPDSVKEAWQFWITDSWVGESANLALAWFWQTAFWIWVKQYSGLLILGAVVLFLLACLGSVADDVAGSDNGGCILLVLCLFFPPLIIILLIVYALKPRENEE